MAVEIVVVVVRVTGAIVAAAMFESLLMLIDKYTHKKQKTNISLVS